MALVNLKFRNTELVLECEDAERIQMLAAKMNRRMDDLAANFHSASDLKLALIMGLFLEDQLDNILKKLEGDTSSSKTETANLRQSFNETLSQIAGYIDHLASRIEKS